MKIPVLTPTLPPGNANALGESSTNTAVSQPMFCQSGGSCSTTRCTTQRTYALWRLSVLCGVLALVSAKASAPSCASCSSDTPPTTCVRPVGDVVVAQPARSVETATASNRRFIGNFLNGYSAL